MWNPPQFDPEWERFLEVDRQTGYYKIAEGITDPNLISSVARYADLANQHLQYRKQAGEKFWQNPYDFIWQGLETKVQDQISSVQEEFRELRQDYETRRFWELMERYEKGLFAPGADGNPDYNQLTPAGEAFRSAYFDESANFRDADGKPLPIEQRMHYAYGQAAPHIQHQQPAPQPAPEPAPQPAQPVYAETADTNGHQPVNRLAQTLAQQPAQQPAPAQPAPDQLQQSNEEFLSRAYAQTAQPQQAPPTQSHYAPDQGGSIASAAQNQIVQNPTESWDRLAEEAQQQLGVNLD